MKKFCILNILFLIISIIIFTINKSFTQTNILNEKKVYLLKIDGLINGVLAQYINKGIKTAEKNNAECIIIIMNTPGGLDTAMRSITTDILNANVPVITYVYPNGSRAASAGVFIGYASNILAMAPETNIGAAHPVSLGGKMDKIMEDKVTNDAVAYLKSIAKVKKHNIDFAENVVRKSISLPAEEALQRKVIDLIADNPQQLLEKINNKKVQGNFGIKILNTVKTKVIEMPMDVRENFLHKISNPDIAYILLIIAIYGLIYEFSNPGLILPGVVGAISLILALFAMESLPFNIIGILLMLLSLIFFIAEAKIPGTGVLMIGGIISFVLGSLILFNYDSPYITMRVSLQTLIPATLVTVLFFGFVVSIGMRALKQQVVSGREILPGKTGIAKTVITKNKSGIVHIEGESWTAETQDNIEIQEGDKVKVIKVKNISLVVEKELNT